DLSRGEACMIGRQDALQGLFGNLFENAVQHQATEISIGLRVGREIEIDFIDNGTGVPEALRQQIFDPFFTTRSSGTGLGLAVVQNLVLSHGGEIHAERAEVGGALFHIRFPLAMEAADERAEAVAVKHQNSEQFAALRSLS
ncbi:MAG: ATP-binding protein, partial [Candidatus Thiodiazotropha sp.]